MKKIQVRKRMLERPSRRGIFLGLFLSFILLPLCVVALEISGRLSTDFVSYGATISSLNRNNASLKLFATITPTRKFDASIIIDAERREYFNTSGLQNYRYRAFYLRYRKSWLEMNIGRQYVPEAVGTDMDGVKIKIKSRSRIFFGAYGGQKAEPYRRGIQHGFRLFGFFTGMQRKAFDASASLTTEYFIGKLNRGYFNVQSSYRYRNLMRFYENLTVDTDKNYVPTYLTYLNLGTYIAPHKKFNFSLSYSRYQAYKEMTRLDLAYLVSFYPTHRYNVSSSLKITRALRIELSRGISIRTVSDSRTNFFSLALHSRGLALPALQSYIRILHSWGELYSNTTTSIGGSYSISARHFASTNISYQSNETVFADIEYSGYIVNVSWRSSFLKRLSLGVTYNYNNSAGPAQNGLFTHFGYRF